jgi:hypothetical protein
VTRLPGSQMPLGPAERLGGGVPRRLSSSRTPSTPVIAT